MSRHPMGDAAAPARCLDAAGVLLGIGLGGFFDGIVLHQLLQWHHMVSSTGRDPATLRGLEVNTLADGVFHLVAWLFVLAGVFVLRRNGARTDRDRGTVPFLGAMAIGWGVFNVVEGALNHSVLRIHHVREDVAAELAWDLGFLAFGLALVVGGVLAAGPGSRRVAATRRPTSPPQ